VAFVRPKTLLKWIAGVLIALAALVYSGDFVWFEFRMHSPKPNDPLETVTFFYATGVKGGKVEVFYDQPQTQTCVHSIFPHRGYKPCWRFNRSGIQLISQVIPAVEELASRDHFAGCAEPGVKGSALGAEAATAMERAPLLLTERTAKK
jgi:hypothetical protein